MDRSSSQLQLPSDVLAQFVFPFLEASVLAKCASVCKEWRHAADEDVLWKQQCARLWQKKRNVPRVVEGLGAKHNEGEPTCLYPFAIFPHSVKLSVKELKQVLTGRMIPTERFIEKSEFQRAVDVTQPTSIVSVRSGGFTSKWKCSYAHSLVRSKVDRITRYELTQTLWKMDFKYNGMTCDARFNGDGTYWSTLGNIGQNGELKWTFMLNSDGNEFDYSAVQVGEYPHLTVRRTKNWGFELHNNYVVFRQAEMRPFA